MPNPLPRYSCARYASARPLAGPPGWNSAGGMSSVVTMLDSTRNDAHDQGGGGEQLAGAA